MGTVTFPRLTHGSVKEFIGLLRTRFETSVVPGEFFDMRIIPDRHRRRSGDDRGCLGAAGGGTGRIRSKMSCSSGTSGGENGSLPGVENDRMNDEPISPESSLIDEPHRKMSGS